MHQSSKKTFAYVDGANLHKGIHAQGWILDYERFRVWLREKYGVSEAYLFIGLIPKYKKLYEDLQKAGFLLVYKEVVYDSAGKPKGNCDADLVVRAMADHFQKTCEQIVLVTSDGDYASLVSFLKARLALRAVLSPANERKCSILLKRTGAPITYLTSVQSHIQKEKAPDTDGTV
ncbi:MAG: NYN domain-containing protein [Patescibacteria group bacterium]|jgi:uncharacterized LabA/DUF88 family protein